MAMLTSRSRLRKKAPPQVKSFICARCSREHNGSGPPPGWGFEPGQGLICDDCEEQLELGRRTGAARPFPPEKRRASA